MNINDILHELDKLFATNQIMEVETFLKKHLEEAKEDKNISNQVTILNELMGYYRDLTRYEDSINICEEAMNLLHREGMQGTIPYATTLQNVANALRAAGQLNASLSYYNTVFTMYENQLEKTDIRYASLYNNMSLLYQEMMEYEKSCDSLKKALEIVSLNPNASIEVATTHTNIGVSLLQLGKKEEARKHLIEAFLIFNRDIKKDHHYSAACAAMGDLVFSENNYNEAAFYYGTAMEELLKHVGPTQNYLLMKEKYKNVVEIIRKIQSLDKKDEIHIKGDHFDEKEYGFANGMDLCRQFYKQHGEPAFEREAVEIINELSFGLIGCGSECYGFDDAYSRDHDWGPSFCVWYQDNGIGNDDRYKKIQQEEIDKLKKIYHSLPKIYKGVIREESPQSHDRVGVMGIGEFVGNILHVDGSAVVKMKCSDLCENDLFTLSSGEIFRQGNNQLDTIRNEYFNYYSNNEYMTKIAQTVHEVSQAGQYNYSRMLKRGDKLTASLYFHKFIESTIDLCYLLNRQYVPYTKWKLKGMDRFITLMDIKSYLEILVEQGPYSKKSVEIIEVICSPILEELLKLGYTNHNSDFLDHHVMAIAQHNREEIELATNKELGIEFLAQKDQSKRALVDAIVGMEWKAFDKVEHIEGCRADCQDNWETFRIMRSSQFFAWPDELLYSYQKDFLDANLAGWNMVTEKYGQMMISTDPLEYEELSKHFPKLNSERLAIIEQIVAIQVKWMEEFSLEYPNVSTGARSIHTTEDSTFNTSYETYLRGELKTYSDKTFKLYGIFIVEQYQKGENLAFNIISNTAGLYGCETVKELEALMN